MRKALILAVLAATTAVPTAAMAQDDGAQTRREERQARRAERQQNRQETRQENRQQVRQNPVADQQEAQRRQQVRQERQVVRQQRQGGVIPEGAWVGNPNDPRMEAARRRYEQLDRQNARRYGTQQQLDDLVARQRATRQDLRQDRREYRQDARRDRREYRQDARQDRREYRQENRADRRAWNRDWRRDSRYDWQRYRSSNRFVFNVQPYYAPYRGYSYNRFGIGMILDRLFWGRNYWISDPWQYRLPAAPIGYQWVRYYDDVVLVDTYSGEIVDVIYDFFW